MLNQGNPRHTNLRHTNLVVVLTMPKATCTHFPPLMLPVCAKEETEQVDSKACCTNIRHKEWLCERVRIDVLVSGGMRGEVMAEVMIRVVVMTIMMAIIVVIIVIVMIVVVVGEETRVGRTGAECYVRYGS